MSSPDETALAVAKMAAQKAGSLLRDSLKTDFKVSKKGPTNLVTEIDLRAESIIIEFIERHFPDHSVLSEEREEKVGSAPYRWVIDPIDGTTNYAHGYSCFCVSIAQEVEGNLKLGVVYDPIANELFWAERNQGAFLNDEPIRVSRVEELIESLVATGFPYDPKERDLNLELFARMTRSVRGVRRDGSAALDLCYVACGRFDGFWEISLNPWDVAAGQLIVEEAGGRVTRFDQSPCGIEGSQVLASNGKLHGALSELLT